jgi:hypothetical protein
LVVVLGLPRPAGGVEPVVISDISKNNHYTNSSASQKDGTLEQNAPSADCTGHRKSNSEPDPATK